MYLLCSDGLTSMVPEERVGEVVRAAARPARPRAAGSIDAANARRRARQHHRVLFRLEEVEPAHAGVSGAVDRAGDRSGRGRAAGR